MTHHIDGPFPLALTATANGAELDISAFLVRAVFTELITQAIDDPQGLAEELADMGELLRSALHQGADSHARHEFDERMDKLVGEFADGGTVPVYATGLRQMREALAKVMAPRSVPSQERRRTA